jgi:hypothetical protein
MSTQGEWTTTTGVVVTATLAPNGKTLLRAEGRMLTAPIPREEDVRIFAAGGRTCRLDRQGDGFTFAEIADAGPQPAAPPVASISVSTPDPVTGLAFFLGGAVAGVFALMIRAMAARHPAVRTEGGQTFVIDRSIDAMVDTFAALKAGANWEIFAALLLIGAAVAARKGVERWEHLLLGAICFLPVPPLLSLVIADRRSHAALFEIAPDIAATTLRGLHFAGLLLVTLTLFGTGVLLRRLEATRQSKKETKNAV